MRKSTVLRFLREIFVTVEQKGHIMRKSTVYMYICVNKNTDRLEADPRLRLHHIDT